MKTKITLFLFTLFLLLFVSTSLYSQDLRSLKKLIHKEKNSKITDSAFSIQQKIRDLENENNLSINIDGKLRLDSIKGEFFFPEYGLVGSLGGWIYSYKKDSIIETGYELIDPNYNDDDDNDDVVPLSEYQTVIISRDEYIYDENYRIIKMNIYEYEYEEGDPLYLSETISYKRDSKGNIIEKKERWRSSPEEEFRDRIENYAYNSSGELAEYSTNDGGRIKIEYWGSDVECRCDRIKQTISYNADGSFKDKYTYGANQIGGLGQVVDFQKIQYYWDGNSWNMRFKFEEIWKDFKGNEKVVSTLKSVRGISNWSKEYEDEYIYDSDGIIIEKNNYWWFTSNRYIIGKEVYTNNNNNGNITFVKSYRNFVAIDDKPPFFEEWINVEKIEFEFDTNDNLIKRTKFTWDESDNDWRLINEETFDQNNDNEELVTFDPDYTYADISHLFRYSQVQAELLITSLLASGDYNEVFKPIDLGAYETPKPTEDYEKAYEILQSRGIIEDLNIWRRLEIDTGYFLRHYYSKTINSYPEFTSIPDINFEKYLIDVGLDFPVNSNQLTDGLAKTSDIFTAKKIDVSAKNIESLTGIEAFQNLDSLIAVGNEITSVDLRDNKGLLYLNLSGNKFSELDVSENVNLKSLKIENDTLLVDLKLFNDYNLSLENLELKNTKLEVLDVLNVPNLKRLNAEESALTELNLSPNFNLLELNVSKNRLSGNVPDYLNSFLDLEYIDISHNNFEAALPDFTTLTKLRFLNVANNYFAAKDLQENFVAYKDLALSPWSDNTWYSPQMHLFSVNTSSTYGIGVTVELRLKNDPNSGGSLKESSSKTDIASDTYQWFKENVPIAGATSDTYTIVNSQVSDSGIYHCEVYNSDMPELIVLGMPYTITISSALGIDEEEFAKNSIVVYPNPAQNYIAIKQNDEFIFEELSIYDVQGRKIKSIRSKFEKISLGNLENGIYFLKIKTDKGESSKQLVITN